MLRGLNCWVVLIVAIGTSLTVYALSVEQKVTCLNCRAVDHPDKCNVSAVCGRQEVCYTEQRMDGGREQYRLGCLNNAICATIATSKRRFIVTSLPYTCLHCCNDTENCNQHICTTKPTKAPAPVLPSTDCFYKSSLYEGNYRTTISGEDCVPWTQVYNASMDSGFPKASVANAENKCRDPEGKGHPWCYTSTVKWEFCPVPFCEECYYTGARSNFTGFTSKDARNMSCTRWSDYGGLVPLIDSMFPDGSKSLASNYCRDPFGFGLVCLTGSGFTKCGIKECPGPCEDDPTTNCHLIKHIICNDEYRKRTMCPKSCGACSTGLLPARIIAPPE